MDEKSIAAALLSVGGAPFGIGSPQEVAETPNGLASGLAGMAQHAVGIPQRAFQASEGLRQAGEYNPAPILEAATIPMGTGAIAGLPMRAGESALGSGFIRAYHGSPYDFDKFDLSKIGTGEGAQAYGHGLYFAENPQTAQAYRSMLAPATDYQRAAAKAAQDYGSSEASLAEMQARLGRMAGRGDPGNIQFLQGMIGELQKGGKLPGHTYEVNINADPAQFLDWDKPLAQQPDNVKSALRSVGVDVSDPALADKIAAAQGLRLHPPQSSQGLPVSLPGIKTPGASQALSSQGVPGIKYLDQGSRYAGDGSRNYVVFNPDIVEIMKKYGIAGVPAAGAVGSALGVPISKQDQPL